MHVQSPLLACLLQPDPARQCCGVAAEGGREGCYLALGHSLQRLQELRHAAACELGPAAPALAACCAWRFSNRLLHIYTQFMKAFEALFKLPTSYHAQLLQEGHADAVCIHACIISLQARKQGELRCPKQSA